MFWCNKFSYNIWVEIKFSVGLNCRLVVLLLGIGVIYYWIDRFILYLLWIIIKDLYDYRIKKWELII